MINLMIIYDVENTFSMKNYKSSRKLRVGVNWYPVWIGPPPLDSVMSVHFFFFFLAHVVCRRVFEVISQFEEKLWISMILKLIFFWKYKYCVTYTS